MKKLLLLAVLVCGGPLMGAAANFDRAVQRYSLMAVFSVVAGLCSELAARQVDWEELVRNERHAALTADVAKYSNNLVINGQVVPYTHMERSQAAHEGALKASSQNFDHGVVAAAVVTTDNLLTRKRAQLLTDAPNTVFTVPFKKHSLDLFFATMLYLGCSITKLGFIGPNGYDNSRNMYPLPHWGIGELVVGSAGYAVGRSMLAGKPTGIFGLQWKDEKVKFGY